jgi:hypothetical protein
LKHRAEKTGPFSNGPYKIIAERIFNRASSKSGALNNGPSPYLSRARSRARAIEEERERDQRKAGEKKK